MAIRNSVSKSVTYSKPAEKCRIFTCINNNVLFMVSHLVRARGVYEDIRIQSFDHTHTHTHPHTHTHTHTPHHHHHPPHPYLRRVIVALHAGRNDAEAGVGTKLL